jgi:hypothetical protein
MKKNCVMFFGAVVVGVFVVGIFAAPQARAYAIGSVSPEAPEMPVAPTSSINTIGASGANYDFGNSLQSLISPFTGFINSLKFNNNTTMNSGNVSTGINGVSLSWPTVNLTPVLESTVQNTLSQWVSQFDNWFYGVTGVQLSGIMVAILGVFLWALGLAQQVVNWLLGLFH